MPRWPLTYDTETEKHTLAHQNNKTLSERLQDEHRLITLAAEEATFRVIALSERLHVIFPGPVLDTGATKHAAADVTAILAHLDKYFLMYPAIVPPVTMPAVLLGATTMTHDGTPCNFPLPGAGVFDASMKETLISVAKLLEANFDIFFRLPHHCLTDGFDPAQYPSYGGFLILPPVAPSLDGKMIILHYADST
jgi:hypothetical protein